MKQKLIIIIFLLFFITGCTSYTELNELSIVNTLGIDYQNGEYQLIVNVVDGSLDDRELEEKYTTYSSKDSSLEEALHHIYLKSNKRLYLSHIDLLVLTPNSINECFVEIIHNFLENNEYRNNFNVILLKDSSLEKFMNHRIAAEEINNLLKTNQKETAMTKVQDFETIIKELLIDKNTYLPTLEYKEEAILRGFTLIQNYQIYEELTLKESILLNLLNNHVQKTYLNQCNIFENQTLITSKKNHISFQLRLITTAMGNRQFQEEIKKDLIDFIKKYQDKNYDILKLTEIIRKNDYSYYQKTKDLLSQITVDISFKIKEKENYLQRGDKNETR